MYFRGYYFWSCAEPLIWHLKSLRHLKSLLQYDIHMISLTYLEDTCCNCRSQRPGLHDIELLFMPDHSFSVYTKPVKQPSDANSCQNNFITSTVVFLAYLPSNRSTSLALKPSYYQRDVWERFVSDHDVFTRNKTVQIVPDPFSYHLLMRSRVVPNCRSRAYRIHAEPYKHSANPK